MSNHRVSPWAIFMASSLACGSACAAFTEPAYDFGAISTYAVTSEGLHAYGVNGDYSGRYTKQLSFSLDSDEAVRIDVRAGEHTYKYSDATWYFGSATFNVFDSAHALIGTAAIDPSYADTSCSYGGTSPLCVVELGLTFSSALKAGSYSFEFDGTITGHVFPEVHFGVALDKPDIVPAYLTAVTPTVPEVASSAMMVIGLTGLMLLARRLKKPTA